MLPDDWLTLLFDRLDEDFDRAGAGQADVPGHLVGDAVAQQLRLARSGDLLGLVEDGRHGTAATDGPSKVAAVRDGKGRADGPRRRSLDLNYRRQGDLVAGGSPGVDLR